MPDTTTLNNRLPRPVVIREVGLRDGLQSIARVLPTEQKLQWIRAAYDAGLRELEVGSFVPPRLLPQLADTAEVLAFAQTLPGLVASVLVPNLKGAQRAIDANAALLLLPLSASHAHSLANLRKTPDDVVADIGRIRAARDAAGAQTLIEVGISTAFGCTLQGEVAESKADDRCWCKAFGQPRCQTSAILPSVVLFLHQQIHFLNSVKCRAVFFFVKL